MNSYHFLFVVRDGKIQQVKVYLYMIHATKCSAPEVGSWRDACLESERAASEWSASIERQPK
jgi:hypothetical protein